MNENKLWSDVLAYKPLVEMTHRKAIQKEGNVSPFENNLSINLINYELYNPCTAIKSLIVASSSINNTLDIFSKDIDEIDSEFVRKYNDGDMEYVNKVIADNTSIDGNVIFEAYIVVRRNDELLKTLERDLRTNYFGEEDVDVAHETTVKTLRNLELSNEDLKINYSTMAVDSYISSIIQSFSTDTVALSDKLLAAATLKKDITVQGDKKSISEVMTRYYEPEKNISIADYKYFFKSSNMELINRLLFQALNSRENMRYAIDADASIPKHVGDTYIDVLMKMKERAIDEAFADADELIKHLILVSLKQEDYINSVKNREGLKNIFVS